MTSITSRLAIAGALMVLTTAALAETAVPGGFANLLSGDQKIARALFEAQHPTASGPPALNLNQIAALKGEEGWGRVFKEMSSEGLVYDKNLGQVVSGYERRLHSAGSVNGRIILTTGSGRTFTTDPSHAAPGKDVEAGAESGDRGSALAGHGHDTELVTVANANGTSTSTGIHGSGVNHTH